MRAIKFPLDESVHNHAIEWWYWNGHLQDKKGNHYSYMDCLFKANLKKVKFPFLKGVPLDTLYFYHSLITDVKRKKTTPHIEYVTLISADSFKKPLLFINFMDPITVSGYLNKVMMASTRDQYHLKTEDMELDLQNRKKPLLEGGDGFVQLFNAKKTYYYSLTNLKTKGQIKIGNKWKEVTGKSWMDHQWANVKYTKDRWTWFSFQLNNNTEIVCFEYGNNKKGNRLASISYADGKQKHSTKIKLIPGKKIWKSGRTKAEYPLEWVIEIPEFDIKLSATAPVKKQEMLFGTINYWEGPLDVKGIIGKKKVNGVGFAELVGYPSEMNNIKFIKNTFEDIAGKSMAYIKRGL